MTLTTADKIARRHLITGSRIARVVGVSPHGGPLSVWREMVEGYEEPETLPMKRGRILEEPVLRWHAEDAGCVLRPVGTLAHKVHKHIGATPDAIATYPSGEERVVEAKTASWRMADQWGEPGTDQIPNHYLCQATFELGVCNLKLADVPVLLGGDDFRQYVVEFDEELFGQLAEAAGRFIRDYVATGKPPPVDASDATREWLLSRFPVSGENLVPATDAAEGWAKLLLETKDQLLALEKREAELKAAFCEAIGTARGMAGSNWKAVWSSVKGRDSVDWEGLARKLGATPQAIAQFSKRGAGYRRFSISGGKKS